MILHNFRTAAGEKLTDSKLIEEIVKFIEADKNFNYKILIGTDSEERENSSDFVMVIVVHRVGQGARYFWKRIELNVFKTLKDRLWQEALFSLELGQEILKRLLQFDIKFSFEIHLDIGENGNSKSVIKEIINLIRSYGFNVKVKPESYAASKIADRLI